MLAPPKDLVTLWMPLLDHLHALHPGFMRTLITRILAHLVSPLDEGSRSESSYDTLLAAWAAWAIPKSDINTREIALGMVRMIGGVGEGVGARKA
jgi:hypothetical protein